MDQQNQENEVEESRVLRCNSLAQTVSATGTAGVCLDGHRLCGKEQRHPEWRVAQKHAHCATHTQYVRECLCPQTQSSA